MPVMRKEIPPSRKSSELIRHIRVSPEKLPLNSQDEVGVTMAVAMASGATVNITTFLESPKYALARLQLQIVEVFVVIFILTAWIVAVVMFIQRWHKLRIVPPPDAMFKNQPKNINKIKVVKKPTESIIYRNYSRRMSKTIIAREKHLSRMNTMPELKIHFGPKKKKLGRLRTLPIIEMADQEAESMELHIISNKNAKLTDSTIQECETNGVDV